MDDKAFLESMSTVDRLVEHADGCGQCEHQRIMAQVARELLAVPPDTEVVAMWEREVEHRWLNTKYYVLYTSERQAGRDPSVAFAKRDWEL